MSWLAIQVASSTSSCSGFTSAPSETDSTSDSTTKRAMVLRNAYGKAQMRMRLVCMVLPKCLWSEIDDYIFLQCFLFLPLLCLTKGMKLSMLTMNWYFRRLQVLILPYDMVHIMLVLGWVKGKKLPSSQLFWHLQISMTANRHQEDFAYSMETYIYVIYDYTYTVHVYS